MIEGTVVPVVPWRAGRQEKGPSGCQPALLCAGEIPLKLVSDSRAGFKPAAC